MNDFPRMDGKICLVTGATSGIGLAAASALAALGAEVAVVGRNPAKTERVAAKIRAESGNARVEAFLADFADLEQVRRLAAAVHERFEHLDVLVNNAGAFFLRREMTPYGVEKTFLVNHLAAFLLTNLLLERLRAAPAARVVNVSSVAHRSAVLDLEDLAFSRGYSGMKAYARSKLANILFTRELARREAGTALTVNALHPGVVATGIWKAGFAPVDRLAQWGMARFALTPEEGADTLLYLATSPEVAGVSGKYFVKRKPVMPSEAARDDALARRLWEVSERLTGLASAKEGGQVSA